MAKIDDASELPTEFYKNVVDVLAKSANFSDFTTSVTLASSKGENYLGNIYRIKIIGRRNDENGAELCVILKIPIQMEIAHRDKFPIGVFYTREAFVYNTLIPKLKELQDMFDIPGDEKVTFVKCFKASSEYLKEFLILEDLRAAGYKMAERRAPLPYHNLKLLLQTLARYHALSFALKQIDPQTYEELSSNLGGIQDYNEDFIQFFVLSVERALNILEDEEVIERIKSFGVDIYAKLSYYLSPDTVDNYTVLCHGDCWNNNVLFKFKGEQPVDVRLIDWQITRNASPVTDIAYLIATSTDDELRHNHLKELMDFYHETLSKTLHHMGHDIDVCYPKKIFDEHLKKIMPFGLLMSFLVLPAVLGEMEDVPDMEAIMKKGNVDSSDLKFENKAASLRYETRTRGVAKFFVDWNFV